MAPENARDARRQVRLACAGHGVPDDRCDDVVLVLSELVGNAVRHDRPPVRYTVAPDGPDVLCHRRGATRDSQDRAPRPATTEMPTAKDGKTCHSRVTCRSRFRPSTRPSGAPAAGLGGVSLPGPSVPSFLYNELCA